MKKNDEFYREINTNDMCDLLGGKYDPYKNSCTFLKEEEGSKSISVSDHPRFAFFYIMQILIGTSIAFFTILFRGSPPRFSSYWYSNLIVLILASVFFIFSDWYRDGELIETAKRFLLIITTFVVVSILIRTLLDFGTIFEAFYWIPNNYFVGEPIIITTISMFTASVLNVFLIPWSEERSKNESF